jgi:hypothetical protein
VISESLCPFFPVTAFRAKIFNGNGIKYFRMGPDKERNDEGPDADAAFKKNQGIDIFSRLDGEPECSEPESEHPVAHVRKMTLGIEKNMGPLKGPEDKIFGFFKSFSLEKGQGVHVTKKISQDRGLEVVKVAGKVVLSGKAVVCQVGRFNEQGMVGYYKGAPVSGKSLFAENPGAMENFNHCKADKEYNKVKKIIKGTNYGYL